MKYRESQNKITLDKISNLDELKEELPSQPIPWSCNKFLIDIREI